MPWWIWMIVGVFFVSRCFGWGARRRYYAMKRWGRGDSGLAVVGLYGACGHRHHGQSYRTTREREIAQPPVELSATEKRERAMADLRRRYVADDITVEEYERELDRLIRDK